MATKNVKKRNWVFIVYPESAPADWRDILAQTGLQCAVSPLHDRDTNEDGTPKKAHWHVIAVYPGPTSYNVVTKLTSTLNAPIPKPIESIRGMFRYLTHIDNPEKFQYDKYDITTINGFNIGDFVELTKTELSALMKNIQRFIRENGIYEYADLCDILLDCDDMQDEYDVAISHTFFFDRYITSRRNRLKAPVQEEGEKNG